MKILFYLLLLFTVATLTSCFHSHRWTEKEKKDFECFCLTKDTFNNIKLIFKGYENSDFTKVTIYDYDSVKNSIDTTIVFVGEYLSHYDSLEKLRSVELQKPFYRDHKYLVRVPKFNEYKISALRMGLHPQYTMTSEGYGCRLNQCIIDSSFHKIEYESIVLEKNK